jgi:hypothetical protein
MKKFLKGFIKNWQGTAIVSGIWLILGWLYTFGIRAAFLIPINYLTGAVLGLEGHNVIGGVVGRTLLMAFVNGFITSIIIFKGSFKERLKEAGRHMKKSILNMIPYFENIADFDFKTTGSRWLNFAGIGLGLATYAFITGNGEWINSVVCIAVFIHVVQEVADKRGVITAVLNWFLSRFGKRRISRKPVEAIVNGYGLGMLLSIIYAFLIGKSLYAYIAGGAIFVISIVLYRVKCSSLRKELIVCEE